MNNIQKFCLIYIILNVFHILITTDSENSICYTELGCFNITKDFEHSLYRPINLLPDSPENINTKIILYTRVNVENGQPVNWANKSKSIKSTNFVGNKKTIFIIHGFLDNTFNANWISKLKDELLIYDDYNVFIVDWSNGNSFPYTQAASNTRLVAAQIALLLRNLNNSTGLKYRDIHLIGHSLGAHIAGYVAKDLSHIEKIGRITGLDPAEPYFQYMPTTVRLDRSDAQFVDVIHTDSKSILQLGLGMNQAIGHIDFYPNGGHSQPGCTESRVFTFISDGLVEGTRQLVACDHQRANIYFIESINNQNKCHFLSFECKDWQSFNTDRHCNGCGKDGSSCAYLGFQSNLWANHKNNTHSRRFYLKTNDKHTYCSFQYRIEIPVNSTPESHSYSGRMAIKLSLNTDLVYVNESMSDIIPGTTYVSVLGFSTNIPQIDSLYFVWEKMIDIFDPNTWSFNIFSDSKVNKTKKLLFINKVFITPLNKNNAKRIQLCSHSDSGIEPEKVIHYTTKDC